METKENVNNQGSDVPFQAIFEPEEKEKAVTLILYLRF